ncbi:MAG: TetM/TetW/TetO/TetS family tetracycline resistance ribosomal protection protein [Eubacteriales bacterium]|nr:TetM/TetW/TetO/TetS family tetracycline resistance ribosomal protection protein [Eubacteriales bacterium]
MGSQSNDHQNLEKEYMSIGLLAHVDAGKTTLSEAVLHRTGAIRSAGRVDHGDAFLDTDAMERDRGITIFSKQASFTTFPGGLRERVWTLVDTPGHADFSTEMERVLQVLDCAVLIISAADGVTGQVRTLWRLLDHYQVPSFLFVNKMDQPGADRAAVYAQIREELGTACVDLQGETAFKDSGTGGSGGSPRDAKKDGRTGEKAGTNGAGSDADSPLRGSFSQQIQEEIAVCDEDLMERFFEGGEIRTADAADLVMRRRLFPVCFGSALREEGVEDLLAMLDALAPVPARGETFGARVFKITHDAGGARLTWMKITGGRLLPRQQIPESPDEKGLPEKASQLRFYKGSRFEALQEAPAGIIVAVPGLSATRAGMGLGAEAGQEEKEQLLQPVMQSRLLLPPDQDLYAAFRKLRTLEEEDPMLHLSYDEEKREITVQIMGQVQREILQRRILERFGIRVAFGEPGIVYRETIAEAAEGVGHFEPLRHYAEVHLLLEPGEPGSGLVFESRCSVNDLALNWQRLILTHLEERRHRGVLTGAEITDMKISIIGGRAHAKHTEGGDFRKATYRAVRQGLMMAKSVLLEPDYDFRLEVPQESVGRAMADLQQMGAGFGQPEFQEKTGMAVLRGTVTVAALGSYAEEVAAYTRGAGTLQCTLRGYIPCKNAEAVIAASGYDPELDPRNPSSSVFCSHGAGTIIPWYEVRSFMHVDTGWRFPGEAASMTQDEALDLAAERARQAALEREKKRRFLEGMEDGPGQAGTAFDPTDTGKEGGIGRRPASGEGGAGRGALPGRGSAPRDDAFKRRQQAVFAQEKELMQIFERTYGPMKPRAGAGGGLFEDPAFSGASGKAGEKKGAGGSHAGPAESGGTGRGKKPQVPSDHYLLVDGYNIIFAWEDLRSLALRDIKAARDSLMDILSNFAGYRPEKIILVFDAYKVAGGPGEVLHWHNIDVVFTKEAETADLYIEKTAHVLAKKYRVTVATSDAVEQIIIFGSGAYRMSAQMLLEEIIFTQREMRERYGIGSDEE